MRVNPVSPYDDNDDDDNDDGNNDDDDFKKTNKKGQFAFPPNLPSLVM